MVIMIKTFIKKNIITLTLAILLLVLSVVSLFIGVIDINMQHFILIIYVHLKTEELPNLAQLMRL